MSLTLIDHPVTTSGSNTLNIFAGFDEINVGFEREDNALLSVGESSSNCELTLSGDFSSLIDVGQSVYFNSTGSTHEYDDSGTVISVTYSAPNTLVVVDVPFVEVSSGGYVNYLQNYYVEVVLINPISGADILGFSLVNDGKSDGDIVVDISIPNDKNSQDIITADQELEEGRIKYQFKYRQVYDGSSESFTTDPEEIITVFANDTPTIETILSSFEEPELYAGYPFFIGLMHSDQNPSGSSSKITYEELDINQDPLVAAAALHTFNTNDYGYLIAIFDTDDYSLNANTRFIKFDNDTVKAPFFSSAFFSSFFDIS
jgi:hypothetical protein